MSLSYTRKNSSFLEKFKRQKLNFEFEFDEFQLCKTIVENVQKLINTESVYLREF
jgi:hypothetical protein